MQPLVLTLGGGAVDARFNDHEKHRWEHEP